MTSRPPSTLLHYLQRITARGDTLGLDDRLLLERFLTEKDAAAFEALVRRHGPMVLGVCRRLLHDPHDCEDAFQATFLLLIRKAGSLRNRELVANWLYGVAYRTALRARSRTAWRRRRESPLVHQPATNEDTGLIRTEVSSILDQELKRLPEKYRLPLLLCYLEGQTLVEAARQLGWPVGTVAGRLARAKKQMQSRLSRRGLACEAGLMGSLLEHFPPEMVAASLLEQTSRAGAALAAGQVPATVHVLALMEGVLKAMFWSKVKNLVAVALAFAVLGVGICTYPQLTAQSSGEKKTEPTKPAVPVKDKLTDLLVARHEAVKEEFDVRMKQFMAGRGTLDILLGCSLRLLKAEQELPNQPSANRLAPFEGHLERMNEVHQENDARYKEGRIAIQELKQAKFSQLDAEIRLERAKRGRPES